MKKNAVLRLKKVFIIYNLSLAINMLFFLLNIFLLKTTLLLLQFQMEVVSLRS